MDIIRVLSEPFNDIYISIWPLNMYFMSFAKINRIFKASKVIVCVSACVCANNDLNEKTSHMHVCWDIFFNESGTSAVKCKETLNLSEQIALTASFS